MEPCGGVVLDECVDFTYGVKALFGRCDGREENQRQGYQSRMFHYADILPSFKRLGYYT